MNYLNLELCILQYFVWGYCCTSCFYRYFSAQSTSIFYCIISCILLGRAYQKLDFLGNMSPKLWPPTSAHLAEKKIKVVFFLLFYKYFIRTCTHRGDIQKIVLMKNVFQGMLNIFTLCPKKGRRGSTCSPKSRVFLRRPWHGWALKDEHNMLLLF